MDVRIQRMESRVQVRDGEEETVSERAVQIALRRLKEELEHDRRWEDERGLRRGVAEPGNRG
jgi:hypothetical protein